MAKSFLDASTPVQQKPKADGFVNLQVILTDKAGTEHSLNRPGIALYAGTPLHDAILANPELAVQKLSVSITSIHLVDNSDTPIEL